jgi:hypothetical protein
LPDGLQKGTTQDNFTGLTTLYSLSLSISLKTNNLQWGEEARRLQWRRVAEFVEIAVSHITGGYCCAAPHHHV